MPSQGERDRRWRNIRTRENVVAAVDVTSSPIPGSDPSTADVVHAVLRSAEAPLTFDEIFARASALLVIRTRDPRATVRGALSQGKQLMSLGDGRFGYLPRLLHGSVVRWPLKAPPRVNGLLSMPDDVRHALFPDFFEIGKRKLNRPARLHLPNGEVAIVQLEHLGEASWGVRRPPPALQRFLPRDAAGAHDDLIVRVLDGEAGEYGACIERAAARDELALARRNRELADAAHGYLVSDRSHVVPIWEIVDALLARGAYRNEVPPAPLEELLGQDERFEDNAYAGWSLRKAAKRLSRPKARLNSRRESASGLRKDLLDLVASGGPQRTAAAALVDALLHVTADGKRAASVRGRRPGKLRIYQLKVTLRGIKPPVWRRLLVRSDTPLDLLHEILQSAMGWFDMHLHAFEVDRVEYGTPDEEFDLPVEDERDVTLAQIAPAVGARLRYRYDFGDDWEHELRLEQILTPEAGGIYPRCVAGRGASPPEDVGGIGGYTNFLEIIADMTHPERAEWLQWAGGSFDPEAFDLQAVNAALELLAPTAST